MADVIAASKSADWRSLDPQNTLYLELPTGRVVIELNPAFAPKHVANIKALVHEHYFDGTAIVRAQDNFVVQWSDPDHTRSLGKAQKTLDAEFSRTANELPFSQLPDPDTWSEWAATTMSTVAAALSSTSSSARRRGNSTAMSLW